MKALFAGKCSVCGFGFEKGAEINYERETKKASHGYCFPVEDGPHEDVELLADKLGFKHHTWPELLKGMKPNG